MKKKKLSKLQENIVVQSKSITGPKIYPSTIKEETKMLDKAVVEIFQSTNSKEFAPEIEPNVLDIPAEAVSR